MEKGIPALSILIVLIYALYNANFREAEKTDNKTHKHYKKHIQSHKTTHYEDELSRIDTDEYTKEYIIKVINNGSNSLNFKGGVMEGGFADPSDAGKIACYTMEFSGKKCNEPYPKDAAMFYTSNCGGCHGNDGRGLGGNYPDLTKKKMLGIEAREMFLKSMLKLQ